MMFRLSKHVIAELKSVTSPRSLWNQFSTHQGKRFQKQTTMTCYQSRVKISENDLESVSVSDWRGGWLRRSR
jgi:hypothetical protein